MIRVAFQGELGAFSEQALRQIWGDGAEPVPQRTFVDVVHSVVNRETDRGVLPVHNAIVGAIQPSLDAIASAPGLAIVDETTVIIKPMLLGLPGVTLRDITRVTSHPAAIGQCRGFLDQHPEIAVIEGYDTAGAARDLVASGDRTLAVIAGPTAAERYGLTVLVERIADRTNNLTRFVVIALLER